MTILPFVCLGFGIILGVIIKDKRILKFFDTISTFVLFLLMVCIGLGIGLDEEIVGNFMVIGYKSMVISLFAIGFSVLFTVLCEKTMLPLKEIDIELERKKLSLDKAYIPLENCESKNKSIWEKFFVWLMPIGLILGLIFGIFIRTIISANFVDKAFVAFLIILYICVGVSQGSNREVLKFVKLLGFKVIWISVAIVLGSIIGGVLAGLLLRMPLNISVVAASGMSFYSITGAFMTKTYGLELGTYGFLVNVMREFLTILLMPILIKVSLGSPIAGGAAGNMDTMLAPITKFVGVRLGLVTLITGTILTFLVPILLPILAGIF